MLERATLGSVRLRLLKVAAGATKTFILDAHRKDPADRAWALCFGMRPAAELYDLKADPDCLRNLAAAPEGSSQPSQLREQLRAELRTQGDPRMEGRGAIFDEYKHAAPGHAGFYERFMAGEKIPTGWVRPTDYEPAPIKAPGAKQP